MQVNLNHSTIENQKKQGSYRNPGQRAIDSSIRDNCSLTRFLSHEDFSRASAGTALMAALGLIPFGIAEATIVQIFGVVFGTMLTNPFGWFY